MAAIEEEDMRDESSGWPAVFRADREQVASDIAGLRDHRAGGMGICLSDHSGGEHEQYDCPDAVRYAAGLRRISAKYGVTVPA